MEDNMSKQKELVQYFLVNTDLIMSAGKIAAQVAHASMLIALRDQYEENFQVWKDIAMKKIILGASEERMRSIIEENPTVVRVIDKGFTEIAPNSLTVVGFPVMTRKDAYKWVHGLKTLKLEYEPMTYNEVQDYIKAESKGKKGIFYLPKLECYTADILVKNPHPISVLEDLETGIREEMYIEVGDLEYIISEVMRVLGKEPFSPYYVYKVNGKERHSHFLDCVYSDALKNYDTFEFVEPITEYFSMNEVKVIKSIISYQKSVK